MFVAQPPDRRTADDLWTGASAYAAGCDAVNEAAPALGGPLRHRNAGSPTKRAAGLKEEAWSVRWAGELR
jgi:hypothetical protein